MELKLQRSLAALRDQQRPKRVVSAVNSSATSGGGGGFAN